MDNIQNNQSIHEEKSQQSKNSFFSPTSPNLRWASRFWWIGLVILLVIIIILIFVLTDNKVINNKLKTLISDIPPCPGDLSGIFTYQLVEVDQIAALIPLGNVNGSDHILPVDHVYFKSYPIEENKHLAVYAPSDMTITQLTMHKVVDNEGNTVAHEHDYAIDAEVCAGLKVWMLAINELAPNLQSAFDNGDKRHDEGKINQNEIAINDTFNTSYKIKAGELLGYTGQKGNGSSIEISIINENQEPDPIVDWDYYVDADRRSGIMCFADLYAGSQKQELYGKFGNYTNPLEGDKNMNVSNAVFIPRTIEPRCGEVIQNIVGTIQGDWFYGKPRSENENMEGEGKVISFIHLNTDPDIGVISIAGTITESAMSVYYEPSHTGTINRESSEVQADGNIYCYKVENQDITGRILVKLIDDHLLKVEYQNGTCGTKESFISPFEYQR